MGEPGVPVIRNTRQPGEKFQKSSDATMRGEIFAATRST
jgi:hypothetical protein